MLWRLRVTAAAPGTAHPFGGSTGAKKHSCACQSAGMGPLLLWRPPLTSAAGHAALKGLEGMLMRPRGITAEWLCCLQVADMRLCHKLPIYPLGSWRGTADFLHAQMCCPFCFYVRAKSGHQKAHRLCSHNASALITTTRSPGVWKAGAACLDVSTPSTAWSLSPPGPKSVFCSSRTLCSSGVFRKTPTLVPGREHSCRHVAASVSPAEEARHHSERASCLHAARLLLSQHNVPSQLLKSEIQTSTTLGCADTKHLPFMQYM